MVTKSVVEGRGVSALQTDSRCERETPPASRPGFGRGRGHNELWCPTRGSGRHDRLRFAKGWSETKKSSESLSRPCASAIILVTVAAVSRQAHTQVVDSVTPPGRVGRVPSRTRRTADVLNDVTTPGLRDLNRGRGRTPTRTHPASRARPLWEARGRGNALPDLDPGPKVFVDSAPERLRRRTAHIWCASTPIAVKRLRPERDNAAATVAR